MKSDMKKLVIVIVAIVLFFVVTFIPIQGLDPVGRMYLGMVICLLIIWFSGAVPAPVTFFIQIGLLTLVMPKIAEVKPAEAFSINMTSLASGTFALLVCAFFIVAAVDKSGLARRVALHILKIVGPKPKMFIVGILFAGAFLNLFLPAAMSVSALLTGIVGGMLTDYKMDKKSNLSKSIYLAVGIGTIAGNMFIQTAGAPAVAITGLISENFGYDISYFEYFKFGLPLAILMDLFAFFFICKMFPSEYETMPGGREYINEQIKSLGKWRPEEIKTGLVILVTIVLWMTGPIHGISTQTVALLACTVLLCPVVGHYSFKELTATVPWGTIIFCASSMSLASGMVTYGTSKWLVDSLLAITHLADMPLVVIVIGALIIMSLCSCAFTVRVAAVNSLVPCVVLLGMAVAERLGASFNPMGFTLVMFYPILFTVILPVHTPYTLIPQAAGGFEAKDLVKVQVPQLILTLASCVLLYFTYWRLVGLT